VRHSAVNHLLDFIGLRHVGRNSQRVRQLVGKSLQFLFRTRDKRKFCAFFRKKFRGSVPNSRRSPSDNNNLIFDIHKITLP
jgi:hypothetical protein